MILDRISALSPADFENFTFDCVQAVGLKNLVWRTPGADGGRDIEGHSYSIDISGHETTSKWYVECKRYSTSIDWPTVYQKIAFADANGADVLLVSTNSNPSPTCESQISEWGRSKRSPAIRFWRGYNFPRLVRSFPHIGAAYGLIDGKEKLQASVLPLSMLISRAIQSGYVAQALGQDGTKAIEAAASLSELMSLRLDQLNAYERVVEGLKADRPPEFGWLDWQGTWNAWEDVPLRAALAFLRYVAQADRLTVISGGTSVRITMPGSDVELLGKACDDLDVVSFWARVELSLQPDRSFLLSKKV